MKTHKRTKKEKDQTVRIAKDFFFKLFQKFTQLIRVSGYLDQMKKKC